MKDSIIGRKAEKAHLARLLSSDKPEFLALYGRRRVGKSFLVNEFFEGSGVFFDLLGSSNASRDTHISRFMSELRSKFRVPDLPEDDPADWDRALEFLKQAIDGHMVARPGEKITIFFDELPWIDAGNSGFLGALDYFWNKHISKSRYGDVLLIVCGSAASWIIEKVINSKGGLHNRVTATIQLRPFSLAETKEYLASNQVFLDNRQICDIYMAVGGIPAYLRHVQPGQSSTQTIDTMCFSSQAPLANEFGRLYASLFENHHNHVKLITALAGARRGLERGELLNRAGLSLGGDSTIYIRELEESGFVEGRRNLDRKKKGKRYFLTDEYSAFYLKWIEPSESAHANGGQNLWTQQRNSGAWNAWAGLAFESICFKHVAQIKAALGISGVLTRESGWYYSPGKGSDEASGAQVDMVIRRADHTTHLCEMKYRSNPILLTRRDKDELLERRHIYQEVTGSTDQVFNTLITAFGAKENQHYLGVVDNQVTLDALFA